MKNEFITALIIGGGLYGLAVLAGVFLYLVFGG
jgi:hypothetical protein